MVSIITIKATIINYLLQFSGDLDAPLSVPEIPPPPPPPVNKSQNSNNNSNNNNNINNINSSNTRKPEVLSPACLF
jgi:hypothetical protein